MKLFAVASLVLTVSSLVGCCSSGACVSSCDPCARELANSGNPFKGLFHHKCKKCDPMGMNCGCEPVFATGCATGNCGSYAAPAAGCGCGSYAAHQTMQQAPAPLPQASPMPTPAAVPAVPPAAPTAPAPPNEFNPTTTLRQIPQPQRYAAAPAVAAPVAAAPQQVSYEEFQRLPGVVISAPAPQAVAAPVMQVPVPVQQPVLTAPQPSAAWAPTR